MLVVVLFIVDYIFLRGGNLFTLLFLSPTPSMYVGVLVLILILSFSSKEMRTGQSSRTNRRWRENWY